MYSEDRESEIHYVLGELRKRINELKSSTSPRILIPQENEFYGITYYTPWLNIHLNIDKYKPAEILKYIVPLLTELDGIKEEELLELKNMKEDFSDETKYDIITNEIIFYKTKLQKIITRYRKYEDNSQRYKVFKYKCYIEPGGVSKIDDLRRDLENYIDSISENNFRKVFSGDDQEIEHPINWVSENHNELHYFITKLKNNSNIEVARTIWQIASNCFTFNGEKIDGDFRGHNSVPSTSDYFDTIINKL